jgi:hypothetical protein
MDGVSPARTYVCTADTDKTGPPAKKNPPHSSVSQPSATEKIDVTNAYHHVFYRIEIGQPGWSGQPKGVCMYQP